jgi:hypothetical protein
MSQRCNLPSRRCAAVRTGAASTTVAGTTYAQSQHGSEGLCTGSSADVATRGEVGWRAPVHRNDSRRVRVSGWRSSTTGKPVASASSNWHVIGCEREDDARRMLAVLPQRCARFKLTIHPQQTRLVRFQPTRPEEMGGGGEGTFDLLALTHYWGRSRRGWPPRAGGCREPRGRDAPPHVAVWRPLAPPPPTWGVAGDGQVRRRGARSHGRVPRVPPTWTSRPRATVGDGGRAPLRGCCAQVWAGDGSGSGSAHPRDQRRSASPPEVMVSRPPTISKVGCPC